MRYQSFLIVAVMLVLLPVIAQAQILVTPETVPAGADGSFEYVAVMTYPMSGAMFGGYTIYNTENIGTGTIWIDGFCMSFVEGGTVDHYVVTGSLEDPDVNGVVTFEWFGCDPGFSVFAATTILAEPVPTETPTWSHLKAMYR
jgi:hypothetical protein